MGKVYFVVKANGSYVKTGGGFTPVFALAKRFKYTEAGWELKKHAGGQLWRVEIMPDGKPSQSLVKSNITVGASRRGKYK